MLGTSEIVSPHLVELVLTMIAHDVGFFKI